MDNEHSKLGEHYKETFSDFRPEPSPAVWEKLAQHPALQATPKPSWFSPAKMIIYAAAITTVAIVLYVASTTQRETAQAPASSAQPAQTPQNTIDNQAIEPTSKAIEKASPSPQAVQKTGSKDLQNKPQQQHQSLQVIVPLKENNTLKTETLNALATKPAFTFAGPLTHPQTANPVNPAQHHATEPSEPLSVNPKSGSNPLEVSPDTMICRGESTTIWATGGESYLWNTGEILPTLTVNPASTTIYQVTITEATGNQSIGTVEVKVAVCEDLYIPNAFTPDGDNLNDAFIVKGENIQSFKMVIFARNGQLVYETSDIQQGWDGKVRGVMGEPTSYTYKINYTDSRGKSIEKKGQLLLLR